MSAFAVKRWKACEVEREMELDDMVGLVAGSLACAREPHYGSAVISDEAIWERARAIVCALVLTYNVTKKED